MILSSSGSDPAYMIEVSESNRVINNDNEWIFIVLFNLSVSPAVISGTTIVATQETSV